MDNHLPLFFALVIAGAVIWWLAAKLALKSTAFIVNSVLGTLVLVGANKLLGWYIPITFPTLLVCAFFGLPGAGSILILYYFKALAL